MDPLSSSDIAAVLALGTPTVVKTPKRAPYRVLKLAEPMPSPERRKTTHLLELDGHFYPCPSAASAVLWGDTRDQWRA